MEEAFDEDTPVVKTGFHSQEVCRNENETRIFCFNYIDKTCAILTLETLTVYNFQLQEIVHQIPFIQNKDNHVISMSYSNRYELYFVYKENNTITILTKYLKKAKVVTSKLFTATNLIYLDDYEMFISRSITNLRFYQLSLKNYSKIGVEGNLDFTVTEGKIEAWNGLSYIEGAYFCKKDKNIENDLLAVWSPLKILILEFPSLKTMHEFEDPAKYGDIRNISNIFFSTNFGYLLVGYYFGVIKIYNLGDKDTLPIASLEGHHKSIQMFAQHPTPNWIVSSSLDGQIIIWNIENFVRVLQFSIPYEAQIHALASYNMVLYSYEGYYYLGGLYWREDFLLSFQTSGAMFTSGYQPEIKTKIKKKQPSSIQSLSNSSSVQTFTTPDDLNEAVFVMDNNSCVIMKKDSEKSLLNAKEQNRYEFKFKEEYQPHYLYPPPKCSKVKFLEKSPYEENRYYILSREGSLIYYSTEENPPKLINYYPYDYFSDGEKPNNSIITSMKFLRLSEENFQVLNREAEFERDLSNQVGILTAGTEDGHVLFIDIFRLKHLVYRYSLHKVDIKMIEGMKVGKDSILVTLCRENILKFSRLSKRQVEIVKTVQTSIEPILVMKAHKSRLFLGTSNGNIGFFKMRKDNYELYGCRQDKPFPDHSGDVDILTLLPKYKLVLTYSQEDNRLKCWDYSYNCLLIIKTSECFTLKGIEYLNENGDFIFCYDYHASVFRLEKYLKEKHVIQASASKKPLETIQSQNSGQQTSIKPILKNAKSQIMISIDAFFEAGRKKVSRKSISKYKRDGPQVLLKDLSDDALAKSIMISNLKGKDEIIDERKTTEASDTSILKGSDRSFKIRKVSLRKGSTERPQETKEESKKSYIPLSVFQEQMQKDVVEIYQRMSYTKPAIPRSKEKSASVGPGQRKKGMADLVSDIWKLEDENASSIKKPTVPSRKEMFGRQNVKNRFIKYHLENLLGKKPDFHRAKEIERQLLHRAPTNSHKKFS